MPLASVSFSHMSDPDAIVAAHEAVILKTAFRLLGSIDDARDAAQEVCLKWLLNRSRVHGDLASWLYRVTVNVCNDHHRRHKRSIELSADRADRAPGPEGLLRIKEQQKLIHRALNALPEQERIAVVLRHIEGFSAIETGAILNIPAATVRSRTYHARTKLVKRLTSRTRPY